VNDMDDGFSRLEQDHREIAAELQGLRSDVESPVVRKLGERLTHHSQLEEAALYPALRRYVDGGDDLADRAAQEHATVATMVAELYDSTTPDRLQELLGELSDAVSAHVAFEETEIFPAMRSCGVDPAQLATALAESEAHAS